MVAWVESELVSKSPEVSVLPDEEAAVYKEGDVRSAHMVTYRCVRCCRNIN